jgi:hypothetical protein
MTEGMELAGTGAEALPSRFVPIPNPLRDGLWNPMSRKRSETWGTLAFGGGGGQRVPHRAWRPVRNDKVMSGLLRLGFEHQVVVEGGLDCGLGAVDCAVVFVGFVIHYVIVASL